VAGELETVYAGRVVPVDVRGADRGAVCRFRSHPVIDGLLAATAIVHAFTLSRATCGTSLARVSTASTHSSLTLG
jgi:hypothetical protein